MKFVLINLAVLFLCGSQAVGQEGHQDTAIKTGQQVVVKLFGAGVGTLDSYGSGVLISDQGHFVTVWNHLVNSGYLTAVVSDGRRFTTKVVGTSIDHDLAVLKLECDDDDRFPFVDWQVAVDANPGEPVLAFSNVFHVATGNEPASVVHGVIACEVPLEAGFGRWDFPVKAPVYILDAVTNNSGAAGGLLTNVAGESVGLLGREIRHRETDIWVNYAVPWKLLRPAIGAILNGRRMAPASSDADKQGISDRRLTAEFGLTLLPGVLDKTPAYVDRIIPKSPAAIAGLQRGDLVLMFEDDVIQSVDDLRRVIAKVRKGQVVSVTVNRDGRLEVLSLRIP